VHRQKAPPPYSQSCSAVVHAVWAVGCVAGQPAQVHLPASHPQSVAP
jgi:hypothetical protein